MPSRGIKAKSFKAWMLANFTKDELPDIARQVDAGWAGLTYYKDTVALYEKFDEEIWAALYEDAQSFGAPNVVQFIADLGGAKDVNDDAHFKNLLVWYMAERVARELTETE